MSCKFVNARAASDTDCVQFRFERHLAEGRRRTASSCVLVTRRRSFSSRLTQTDVESVHDAAGPPGIGLWRRPPRQTIEPSTMARNWRPMKQ